MTVKISKMRQRYEVSKALTNVRTAIRTTLIPVTVGIFSRRSERARSLKTDDSYEDGGFEASKTTTVTRMATPSSSIPVTVGTVEAWGVGGGGGGSWRTENL